MSPKYKIDARIKKIVMTLFFSVVFFERDVQKEGKRMVSRIVEIAIWI
jgi:hypothetical protein